MERKCHNSSAHLPASLPKFPVPIATPKPHHLFLIPNFVPVTYIYAGEHDDNMISLHEIDWKIKTNNRNISLMLLATLKILSCLKNYCYHDHDNRHIVKSPCLPQSFCQDVLTEFEYQLQLELLIHIELTINYKYPNEF